MNLKRNYLFTWVCMHLIEKTLTRANCVNRTPFSLSLQPLTAFAELSYGRRDFATTEGRKTEKGMVERIAEGEVDG